MAESKALRQISEFRTELMQKMPFYGDILSHLDVVEDNDIESAGTNGRTIYYNRRFVERLNSGQLNYIMMHELFHVLLFHFKRHKGKDGEIWNVAADYVVNGLLDVLIDKNHHNHVDYGIPFEKPPFGCFLDSYEGQSAEELYKTIYEKNIKNPMRHFFIFVLKEYDFNGNAINIKVKINSKDMDLIGNLSKEEIEQLEKEITNLIENAEKNWSKDSSRMLIARQLNILKHEKRIPWKKLLKRFLMEGDAEDTSYDHPERKYLHMDMILPGIAETSVRTKMDHIWAFIDTSASIDSDEMNEFATQLYDICKQFDSTVNIGYWDTEMHEVYMNVSKNRITRCVSYYSGGTDANAIYDYLEENKINPRVMLILTDGYFEPVNEMRVRKYKNKTILVLTNGSKRDFGGMGKMARL